MSGFFGVLARILAESILVRLINKLITTVTRGRI